VQVIFCEARRLYRSSRTWLAAVWCDV